MTPLARLVCLVAILTSLNLGTVRVAAAEETGFQHFLSCFSALFDPATHTELCGPGQMPASQLPLSTPVEDFGPAGNAPAPSCCSCESSSLIVPADAFEVGSSRACGLDQAGRTLVACCPCGPNS